MPHEPVLYAYFYLVLLLCGASGWALWLAPGPRQVTLAAGLLSIPGSFLTVLFVPEYWQPIRLFGWLLGIEDVLFSFATGILVWALASWHLPPQTFLLMPGFRAVGRRFLNVWLLGGGLFSMLSLTVEMALMPRVLLVMLITCLVAGWQQRTLLPVFLKTACVFSLCYIVLLGMSGWVFPEFARQWTWRNLSGITLFSFPVEEFAWAWSFGFSWSMIMAYLLDVDVERSPQDTPV